MAERKAAVLSVLPSPTALKSVMEILHSGNRQVDAEWMPWSENHKACRALNLCLSLWPLIRFILFPAITQAQ